mgnify:CR=1 FL=1
MKISPAASLCALLSAQLLLAGCSNTAIQITPVPADPALVEKVLLRDSPFASDRIAIIDLSGIILTQRPPNLLGVRQGGTVSEFTEQLELAARDQRVKAIIVRINSPGGTVTASDLCHHALASVNRDRPDGKKLVVLALAVDIAASGAYYTACAADEIWAHPTSLVGSIGVILNTVSLASTFNKIGLTPAIYKSGPLKDSGSFWRDPLPADNDYLQGIVNTYHARFREIVQAGRPALRKAAALDTVADGSVFIAPRALELGLIDRIGSAHDIIARAKELAGIRQAVVVVYARAAASPRNVYDILVPELDQPNAAPTDLDAATAARWLLNSLTPTPLYLWPG